MLQVSYSKNTQSSPQTVEEQRLVYLAEQQISQLTSGELLCSDICFPVLCELPLSCEWERKAVSHRIIEYPKNIIESNPWLHKGPPKIQTPYLKALPKGFLKAGSLEPKP